MRTKRETSLRLKKKRNYRENFKLKLRHTSKRLCEGWVKVALKTFKLYFSPLYSLKTLVRRLLSVNRKPSTSAIFLRKKKTKNFSSLFFSFIWKWNNRKSPRCKENCWTVFWHRMDAAAWILEREQRIQDDETTGRRAKLKRGKITQVSVSPYSTWISLISLLLYYLCGRCDAPANTWWNFLHSSSVRQLQSHRVDTEERARVSSHTTNW